MTATVHPQVRLGLGGRNRCHSAKRSRTDRPAPQCPLGPRQTPDRAERFRREEITPLTRSQVTACTDNHNRSATQPDPLHPRE